MSRPEIPHDSRTNAVRVKVTRVMPDVTLVIRTLSPYLWGLFSHWKGKRSFYCPGADECDSSLHRIARQWKGYLAVEVWTALAQRWVPTCLEVTEHCELDMRDWYARGQVWEVSREREATKKKNPVSAKFLESRNENDFPQAFDLLPILRAMYHDMELVLGSENPMPGRVHLVPSIGEPPPMKVHPAESSKLSPADEERKKKLMDEWHKRGRVPSPNGSPAS